MKKHLSRTCEIWKASKERCLNCFDQESEIDFCLGKSSLKDNLLKILSSIEHISYNVDNAQYEIIYESYFNPHANPKSLYDKKSFNDVEDMVDFILEKFKDEI